MAYIAIIGEEKEGLAAIKTMLSDFGHQTSDITKPERALAGLLDEPNPDLCILDLTCQNTKETINAAKSISNKYAIPVLFTVNPDADITLLQNALLISPEGFIVLPAEPLQLRLTVESLMMQQIGKMALLESEEKYRAIVENTHDAVYIYRNNRFIFVNRRLTELLGYTGDELLGKPFQELLHPDDRERLLEYSRMRARKEPVPEVYEARVITKAGETRIFSFRPSEITLSGEYAVLGAATDITDQQEYEHALIESEKKYRSVIENISDVYYRSDGAGIITMTSPSGPALFGYDSVEEVLGLSLEHLWEDPQNRYKLLEKMREKGKLNDVEIVLVRKDGSPVSVSLSANFLYDDQGALLGTEGILRDISERKQAEEKLRQSEERMRRILESTNDGYYEWNIVTGEIFINDRYVELLGYAKNELPEAFEEWQQHVHPDDLDTVMKHLTDAIAGKSENYSAEYRMMSKNGEWVWIADNGRVVEHDADGNPVRFAGAHHDITEQKKTEDALRESEQRLRTLINAMHDIVCFKDGKGCWLEANEYDLKLFQLEGVDYRGKKDSELAEYSDFYRDAFLTCEETDEIAWNTPGYSRGIETIPRPDGETFIFDIIKVPTFEQEGVRKGLVVVGRDITELKRTEEQLKSSLLEKEVLLREVHHRVKNNFQVITSLLNLQSGTITDTAQVRQFNEIKTRIRSMALIHEKLYQSDDMAHIDFSSYIRTISHELYQNHYSSPGAPELSLNCDNISLTVDQAIPCGLIINELLTNIMKYAFPPGFSGEKTIHISFHEFTEYRPVLRVRDTGVGIPETLNFEKNESLGLTLVRMLTLQLQGNLAMNRERGTEFIISFIRK